jgi:hypothetical protein
MVKVIESVQTPAFINLYESDSYLAAAGDDCSAAILRQPRHELYSCQRCSGCKKMEALGLSLGSGCRKTLRPLQSQPGFVPVVLQQYK